MRRRNPLQVRNRHISVAARGERDWVIGGFVALAAASRSPEVANDLAEVLLRDLEDGPYGHGYLRQLDHRLFRWASP